jgi:hypothetical protein
MDHTLAGRSQTTKLWARALRLVEQTEAWESFRPMARPDGHVVDGNWTPCGPAADFGLEGAHPYDIADDLAIAKRSGNPLSMARCLAARAMKGA